MKGKVLRPIPGTGYSIGELASFTKEGVEKYGEYLENKEYFEVGGKADDEEEPIAKTITEDDETPKKKKQ